MFIVICHEFGMSDIFDLPAYDHAVFRGKRTPVLQVVYH